MNLVKLITDQFSDETLGKLGALLGTDSETASAAATAAVPTLLSGLSGLASRGDGAKRLTDVLSGIDAGSMGNFAQLLGGDTGALLQRGSGLLSSLFGDGLIATAANAISRYSGISPDSARRLLAFIAPVILGKLAGQWRSQGGTVGALTTLFADQKRNIADAVPAGFSLAEIPGLAGAGETAKAATQTVRRGGEMAETASGSVASWLLPLAVLIVGGFLLWNFLSRPAGEADVANRDAATTTVMKPVAPDAADTLDASRVANDAKSILTSFTDQLGAIRDAATAEAALPKLEEVKTKLDTLSTAWARLPESGQPTIRQQIDGQMSPLKQKAEDTLAIPGISERVKALINDILRQLTEFATQPMPAAAK